MLNDGRVLVTGGTQYTFGPDYVDPSFWRQGDPIALASVEAWSPTNGKWTSVAPMQRPRQGHTATLLPDGRVLVVGGETESNAPAAIPAELWTPSTGRWSSLPGPRWQRAGHTATLLPDGRVLIVGGMIPAAGLNLTSIEIWDPHTNAWTDAAPMPTGRSSHSAVLLQDGRILIAGGHSYDPPEIWEPQSDQWSLTPPVRQGMGDLERLVPLPDGRVLFASGTFMQIWER